ncbi:hypothetical protein LCGC14_1174900 [marine sediment metagenome]|uniref:Uncharacterized protein n=1 Tax=marine sediment metagenome TaxID=412755 RepID=A0A0F9LTN4_9ZZZZ
METSDTEMLLDEGDYPEYEEYTPSPEQIAYAKSLVGKWVEATSGYPYYPCLAQVVRQGDYSRGGNPGQVLMRVFRASNTWDWLHWKLMWHDSEITQCTDSSWFVPTDIHPTLRDYLRRYLMLTLRTPVRYFLKVKFELRTYSGYVGGTHKYSSIPANLYGGIYDVFYWMKHGQSIP